MRTLLARNWWFLLVRGTAAILFGLLVLLFPTLAIETFVLFFGAYALIDGAVTAITAIQNRTQSRWWVYLLEGVLGVVAGVIIFANPLFAMIALPFFALYIVAFWAIATGIMEIGTAIQLRKEIEGEFWMGLGGALSILFGILLIINPAGGILTLLALVGAYAIAFGVVLILLAFRVRGRGEQTGAAA